MAASALKKMAACVLVDDSFDPHGGVRNKVDTRPAMSRDGPIGPHGDR